MNDFVLQNGGQGSFWVYAADVKSQVICAKNGAGDSIKVQDMVQIAYASQALSQREKHGIVIDVFRYLQRRHFAQVLRIKQKRTGANATPSMSNGREKCLIYSEDGLLYCFHLGQD